MHSRALGRSENIKNLKALQACSSKKNYIQYTSWGLLNASSGNNSIRALATLFLWYHITLAAPYLPLNCARKSVKSAKGENENESEIESESKNESDNE